MNPADNSRSTSPSSTSTSLIVRVQAGDQFAWQRFSAIYGPLVYSWARRAGLQAEDASDIGQEVFRSVATAINDFRSDPNGGGFRAWLWTITRNKIRDHFRRASGQPGASGGTDAHMNLQELPDSPPSEDSDKGDVELSQLSRRALEQVKLEFEDKTWKAFWRVAVEGDSVTDIAADLGVTKWAIYKAKARVVRRLRQELGDVTF